MSDLLRRFAVSLPLAVLLLVGVAVGTAPAANCGGSTACKCGDTVTRSAALAANIGVCTGTGLKVLSGVTLDCRGRTITGNNLSNAKYGVLLDKTKRATVKNCRITGFRKGIRLAGGSENQITGNELFTNGDYGIDLSGGSRANVMAGNNLWNNRDEGIHVGTGAHDNVIRDNILTRNKHENIYVLDSDGTRITGNTITTNDSAAIFLKHANDSYVADNIVLYGAIYVRGDSAGNTFEDNALRGNGYYFQAYLEAGMWTFPHDNDVLGGQVENTKTCLRFEGAYDNTVEGLRLDDECQVTMVPAGGQASSGNVVHTLPLP
jgi:parallel beta-helix repeat protein